MSPQQDVGPKQNLLQWPRCRSAGTLIASLSYPPPWMWYYAAPFNKEHHTRTTSSRVTTDTAAAGISKKSSCSSHDLQVKSCLTHTRSPNSNCTKNFISSPCRLHWLVPGLSHVMEWRWNRTQNRRVKRILDKHPRNNRRNFNGDCTESHGCVHVLRDCKVPCPPRYGWSSTRGAVRMNMCYCLKNFSTNLNIFFV